ncbi:hypothetical protein DMUE_2594 [Dictyocoela muelleri]|nr:hypothetical protein DMUE_2594 [Dictyocoela muelleri]
MFSNIFFLNFVICKMISVIEFNESPEETLRKYELKPFKELHLYRNSASEYLRYINIDYAIIFTETHKYIVTKRNEIMRYDPKRHLMRWMIVYFDNQKEYVETIIKLFVKESNMRAKFGEFNFQSNVPKIFSYRTWNPNTNCPSKYNNNSSQNINRKPLNISSDNRRKIKENTNLTQPLINTINEEKDIGFNNEHNLTLPLSIENPQSVGCNPVIQQNSLSNTNFTQTECNIPQIYNFSSENSQQYPPNYYFITPSGLIPCNSEIATNYQQSENYILPFNPKFTIAECNIPRNYNIPPLSSQLYPLNNYFRTPRLIPSDSEISTNH